MKVVFVVVEDKYFLMQRLNLAQSVKNLGHEVVVVSQDTGYSSRIIELGFKFVPMANKRAGRNPIYEFIGILELAKLYKELSPDLVHHVSIKPVLYGSIAAKLAGVKKVVNLVNGLGFVFSEEKSFKRSLFKILISLFYKIAFFNKSIKVIFQNPDDRNYFVSKGLINREKTYVILGSGVDMEQFSFAGEPGGRVQVLFCARMIWDKGIKYLVEASRILKNKGLEFDLNFVGSPDESNPQSLTESQLKDWNDQGLINYKGFQTNIPEVIKNNHIVVLPTFYREGVPLSLIESASVGRPIVTTDMPGCREIVQDNHNGFIVPIKDSRSIAEALEKLIISKDLRVNFGKKSRQLVENSFSKEIVNKKTLEVYNSF
jgi:glycosyltransferase involved in cell wall biosynthesis